MDAEHSGSPRLPVVIWRLMPALSQVFEELTQARICVHNGDEWKVQRCLLCAMDVLARRTDSSGDVLTRGEGLRVGPRASTCLRESSDCVSSLAGDV